MVDGVVSRAGGMMKPDPGLLVLLTVWLKIYHVPKPRTAKYEDLTTVERYQSSSDLQFPLI